MAFEAMDQDSAYVFIDKVWREENMEEIKFADFEGLAPARWAHPRVSFLSRGQEFTRKQKLALTADL